MKTIKKFFILICLITTVITSTSCLKDDPMFDWNQMKSVIELPYKTHFYTLKSVVPTSDVSFDLMVNYTVPYESDNVKDIPVSLAVAPDLIAAYNQSLGTASGTYIELPASAYTLPTPVIPAGKRLYSAPFVIKTAGLQPKKKYILPIKIVGVPEGYTISGNFGVLYLRIDMK